MERAQCKALIEAILFLKEEPVKAEQLAKFLESSPTRCAPW